MSHRQSDTLPGWGRPKSSVISGGSRLNRFTDGYFTEDQIYRRKKKKGAVKWQSISASAVTDDDTMAENPSASIFVPDQWDLGLGELDDDIHYDVGYSQQERDRKVRSTVNTRFFVGDLRAIFISPNIHTFLIGYPIVPNILLRSQNGKHHLHP